MNTKVDFYIGGQFVGSETFKRVCDARREAGHRTSLLGGYVIQTPNKTHFHNVSEAIREAYQ